MGTCSAKEDVHQIVVTRDRKYILTSTTNQDTQEKAPIAKDTQHTQKVNTETKFIQAHTDTLTRGTLPTEVERPKGNGVPLSYRDQGNGIDMSQKRRMHGFHSSTFSFILRRFEWSEDFWFAHNLISMKKPEERNIAIENNPLRVIKKSLKIHEWKGFQNLKLHLSVITPEELKLFRNDTSRQFASLRKLSLKLPEGTSTYEIETFGTNIGRNLNLKRLTVEFGLWNQITDPGLKMFSLQTSRYLYHLTYLEIDFCNASTITTRGIRAFGSEVSRHLVNVKQLKLKASNSPRTVDGGVETMVSQISRRRFNVQSLTLDFSGCGNLTDRCLETLKQKMHRNLTELKELVLTITRCNNITDKGIDQLALGISQRLTNLQRLSLDFSGCKRLTEKGLVVLGSSLSRNFVNLRQLVLNFSSCYKIPDRGLEIFGLQISQNMKKLEHLELSFNTCRLITDHGLEIISRQVIQLTNLRQLVLDFGWCDITDNGLDVLGSLFDKKCLPYLEDLTLDFRYCEKITDRGKEKLARNLQFIPSLQSLWKPHLGYKEK